MSGLKQVVPSAASENICAFCGIGSSGLCAALSPQELAEFERLGKHVAFSPKDALFSQGERSTRVYIITDGVVRLYKLLPDGRRQVIGFKLPGDLVGLSAAETHALSGDAINHVMACQFPKQAIARFSHDKLAMLRRMNEMANRELTRAHERMMLLGRFTADEKMASFLVGWRDRLAEIGRSKPDILLPMSRRDIADYLGLTIETVSRTFTKLEKEKVFAVVAGGVRIVDEKRALLLASALPRR
jgi:CRP/FNR family transcriptional regulator, anaerobic regulatory protein